MIENQEDKLFRIQLSTLGAHFVKKNAQLVKWLFLFSTIGFVIMLIFHLFQLHYFNRQNAAHMNANHSPLYFLYLTMVPILGMLQLIIFLLGAFSYFKFARQIDWSIAEMDETGFNHAFRWLLRASLLWIFQTVVAIADYSLVLVLFVRRVSHNM